MKSGIQKKKLKRRIILTDFMHPADNKQTRWKLKIKRLPLLLDSLFYFCF